MTRTFGVVAAPAGHTTATIVSTRSGMPAALVCACGRAFLRRADLAAHHNLERMLGAPR